MKQGSAAQSLEVCMDENADPYSDVFTIDAQFTRCIAYEEKNQLMEI